MTWFAHYLGGPLDGEVAVVDSYSPYAVRSNENCSYLYRLVHWVPGADAIEPYTSLVYVWVGLSNVETRQALRTFGDQQTAWTYQRGESTHARAHG